MTSNKLWRLNSLSILIFPKTKAISKIFGICKQPTLTNNNMMSASMNLINNYKSVVSALESVIGMGMCKLV